MLFSGDRFAPLASLEPAPTPANIDLSTQQKLELIFSKFDSDSDGFLNMTEANQFMEATGALPFTKKAWSSVCRKAGTDPVDGLDIHAFGKVEQAVDEDYDLIFAGVAVDDL